MRRIAGSPRPDRVVATFAQSGGAPIGAQEYVSRLTAAGEELSSRNDLFPGLSRRCDGQPYDGAVVASSNDSGCGVVRGSPDGPDGTGRLTIRGLVHSLSKYRPFIFQTALPQRHSGGRVPRTSVPKFLASRDAPTDLKNRHSTNLDASPAFAARRTSRPSGEIHAS